MYFCYGIHHSREGTLGTSYSMLLSSGGRGSTSSHSIAATSAKPTAWGFGNIFGRNGNHKNDDKTSIIVDEDDS